MSDRQSDVDSKTRRRRMLVLLLGAAAGGALLVPRKWLSLNDVTTGRTPEYSDLQPSRFGLPADTVFEAARRAARQMARWKLVDEDPARNTIQAEVKTFLLPFIDDVTIWVEPENGGSLVMVRSHSRIGKGDLGENARTIRAFQRVLDEQVRALQQPGRVGRPDPGVGVLPASEGTGPLLQRRYDGIILESDLSPDQAILMVRTDIERFSDPQMARFIRPPHEQRPLEVGDEIEIHLVGAGETHVKVVHVDQQSFTLRTMEDHLEAGRITFGFWTEGDGRLMFRIQSRARQASPFWLLGYVMGGMKLQARIWETFIERVADAAGGRLEDDVKVTTDRTEDTMADRGEIDTPTFKVPAEA